MWDLILLSILQRASLFPDIGVHSCPHFLFRTEKMEIITRFKEEWKGFLFRIHDLSFLHVSTHRIQ